jgi:hypothetical protein
VWTPRGRLTRHRGLRRYIPVSADTGYGNAINGVHFTVRGFQEIGELMSFDAIMTVAQRFLTTRQHEAGYGATR